MIDIVFQRLHGGRKPTVSFIFLDWSCRESFHSLDYLNNQNVDRESYEIIWIEYYDTHSAPLNDKLTEYATKGSPAPIDLWTILGMEKGLYYHKHLMYNVGLIQARGDIIIICDSDAMFPENFVETVITTFKENPNSVVHFDEVRNSREEFYPFNYPSFDEIRGPGAINWRDGKTTGLWDTIDPLHSRNYGACFCARRSDLIDIGGADEHLDYLGHVCGPYELTFRLVNKGLHEIWHDSVFIYHTWHPGSDGEFNYFGPSDGRHMSTTALEARSSGRVMPLLENAAIRALRQGHSGDLPAMIDPTYSEHWTQEAVSRSPRFKLFNQTARAPKLVMTIGAHNVVEHSGQYFGVPHALGPVDLAKEEDRSRPGIIKGTDLDAVKALVVAAEAEPPIEYSSSFEDLPPGSAIDGLAEVEDNVALPFVPESAPFFDELLSPEKQTHLGKVAEELLSIVTRRYVHREEQNLRLLELEEDNRRRQQALEQLRASTEVKDRAIAALKDEIVDHERRASEREREARLWREQALNFASAVEVLPLLNRKEFSIDTGTDVSVMVNSEGGHFLFGPYLPLQPGFYEIRVLCHADRIVDEEKPVLTIEIADRSEVLGLKTLVASDAGHEFAMDFQVPPEAAWDERKVEFRLSHHGNGNIKISSVKLSRRRAAHQLVSKTNMRNGAQRTAATGNGGRFIGGVRFFSSAARYARGEPAS